MKIKIYWHQRLKDWWYAFPYMREQVAKELPWLAKKFSEMYERHKWEPKQ